MGLLRLLLAVSVVLDHTNARYTLAGGRISVQLFYMISGFLISYVLANQTAYEKVHRFYVARALRIFPVYYAVAITVLILFQFQGERLSTFSQMPPDLKVFMIAVNVTVLGQDWTNFISSPSLPLHKFLLVPQGWTLGVELAFYAMAPFLLRSRTVVILVLAASLAARATAFLCGFSADPWSYRFFPFELALFAAGALSHQILLPLAQGVPPKHVMGGTIAMLILAASSTALPIIEPFRSILVFSLAFGALPLIFLYQRNHSWDAYIGQLSYPLYIVHWAVAMVVLEFAHRLGRVEPPFFSGIVLALSLVGALVLDFAVVRPVERIRAILKA